jgi:hypothetical protein
MVVTDFKTFIEPAQMFTMLEVAVLEADRKGQSHLVVKVAEQMEQELGQAQFPLPAQPTQVVEEVVV